MKYICLGFFDKSKREGMTEGEQTRSAQQTKGREPVHPPFPDAATDSRYGSRINQRHLRQLHVGEQTESPVDLEKQCCLAPRKNLLKDGKILES